MRRLREQGKSRLESLCALAHTLGVGAHGEQQVAESSTLAIELNRRGLTRCRQTQIAMLRALQVRELETEEVRSHGCGEGLP
jgi:hypothetical protein